MDALELEEAVRLLVGLRKLKTTDSSMQHRLLILERNLISKLTSSLTFIITDTLFFASDPSTD